MSRLLLPPLALALGVGCAVIDSTGRSSDREDPFDTMEETPPADDDGDRTFDAGDDAEDVADIPGADEDACRTRGYWINHPEVWPVDALVLGDRTYDQDALIAVLDLPSGGDASRILAAQVIASELNLSIGAPAEDAVLDALDDAQAWLAAHDTSGLPFDVQTSSDAGAEAVGLAGTLDDFNNRECPR